MGPHGGLWGPHGASWGAVGLCGAHSSSCHAFFARIFVIISIFAFSADFHDFLENELATPGLGESGERANPWVQGAASGVRGVSTVTLYL